MSLFGLIVLFWGCLIADLVLVLALVSRVENDHHRRAEKVDEKFVGTRLMLCTVVDNDRGNGYGTMVLAAVQE